MSDPIERLCAGALGEFLIDGDSDDAQAGYVRLSEQGWFEIATLADSQDLMTEQGPRDRDVAFICAATTATSAAFLDVQSTGPHVVLAGYKASTENFRAGIAVAGVVPDDVVPSATLETQVDYHGVNEWFGFRPVDTKFETDDQHRLTSVTAKVEAVEPLSHGLGADLVLKARVRWNASHDDDAMTFDTPASVSIESETGCEVDSHLVAHAAVQDLLSLAYEGFAVAHQGAIRFAGAGIPMKAEPLWCRRLMFRPPGIDSAKSKGRPLFSLADLGGMGGVCRWVELRALHPRAAGPLVTQYRIGSAVVEHNLLAIASAIEYYDAACRRSHSWAKQPKNAKKDEPLPMRMVRQVGKPFAELVQKPDAWADRFWAMYNGLKHDPSHQYDPYEMAFLTKAGRVLLLCTLLMEVAGNGLPAAAVCRSHRLEGLRRQLPVILS